MDSSVIGAFPMVGNWGNGGAVSGFDDVDGYDVDGYDEVGRRRRRHGGGAPGMVRVPNISNDQMQALAKSRGLMLVQMNPNQGGGQGFTSPTGHQLLSSGQRMLPAAFIQAAAVAPGAPWSVVAQIQRGYQATRLLVDSRVDATGADASGFIEVQSVNVGQRNQVVSPGQLPISLFLPNTFDARMLLDPAGTGNFLVLSGIVTAGAPGPITVRCGAIGAGSL